MIYLSFVVSLTLFLIIGLLSATKSKKTTEDYLIAGKSVSPLFVGLSAIATNNSGFMFIGMIGTTYKYGLSSIWLMIGWIVGDFIASRLTLRRIHNASRKNSIHSFGGLLANWFDQHYSKIRTVAGTLTLFFLILYAAVQLVASSKAASGVLNWPMQYGIIISGLIILAYSLVGGIRASIWTDVAQSIVMLLGMLALFVSFFIQSDFNIIHELNSVSDTYMNWFPDTSLLEIILFIVGWLFGGFAVIGQPHIIIRFMSLDKQSNINRMRVYYYGWFIVFYGLTILVGLLSRLMIQYSKGFDPELALPTMATLLLPDIIVGLVVAAMFAAAMSTADSLILACSASLTRDIFPKRKHTLLGTKLATFLILSIAVSIGLTNNHSVFTLVLDAWGLLASAFAPVIVAFSFNKKLPEWLAIFIIITGPVVYMIWKIADLDSIIYSVAPGIVYGLVIVWLYCVLAKNKI